MNANVEKSIRNLSLEELIEVRDSVAKLIRDQQQQKRKDLLVQYRELAAASGFSLEEVVGAKVSKRAAKTADGREIKYRNPDNAAQTWTGRGPKPKWFKASLESGKTLDELLA